jgi:hypothetical protein
MHRVVSLGNIDDSDTSLLHLDDIIKAIAAAPAKVCAVLASDELWDALWDATVQLYHGCALRAMRAICAIRAIRAHTAPHALSGLRSADLTSARGAQRPGVSRAAPAAARTRDARRAGAARARAPESRAHANGACSWAPLALALCAARVDAPRACSLATCCRRASRLRDALRRKLAESPCPRTHDDALY